MPYFNGSFAIPSFKNGIRNNFQPLRKGQVQTKSPKPEAVGLTKIGTHGGLAFVKASYSICVSVLQNYSRNSMAYLDLPR